MLQEVKILYKQFKFVSKAEPHAINSLHVYVLTAENPCFNENIHMQL